MNIEDYLREDRILVELKARDKEGAIREIAGLLTTAHEITDFDTFLQGVFEREKIGSTGIGHEVAIPHARTDTVDSFLIAIGRAPEGVDFDSVDGKPVKLIFLMGTPEKKGLNDYLKILAHLTRLLKKESFVVSLMEATDAKAIIETFKKAEE